MRLKLKVESERERESKKIAIINLLSFSLTLFSLFFLLFFLSISLVNKNVISLRTPDITFSSSSSLWFFSLLFLSFSLSPSLSFSLDSFHSLSSSVGSPLQYFFRNYFFLFPRKKIRKKEERKRREGKKI